MKKEFEIEKGKIVIKLESLFNRDFTKTPIGEDFSMYGNITLYLPNKDGFVSVYKTNTSYSIYKVSTNDISKLTDIWIDEFIEKNKTLILQIEKKATDLVKIKEHINLLPFDLVNTMLNELKADNAVSYYLKS